MLEKITHCALIALCVASLAVLAKRELHSPGGGGARRTSWVGEHIVVPGIDWSAAPRNVLIGLRSNCPYCKASMPGYRKLSRMRSAGKGIRIYVISSEPERVTSDFLSKSGVSPDAVGRVDMPALGMLTTPTVYVVDGEGVVQGEYVGAGQDSALIARLDTAAGK